MSVMRYNRNKVFDPEYYRKKYKNSVSDQVIKLTVEAMAHKAETGYYPYIAPEKCGCEKDKGGE